MLIRKSLFLVLLISLVLVACAPVDENSPTAAPTEEVAQEAEPTSTSDLTQATVDLGEIVSPEVLPVVDDSGRMVCQVLPGILSPENQQNMANYEIIGPVTETETIKGPVDAKLTIVEYSEFQCPYCKAAFYEVERFRAAFPEDVRVVYRHLPLASIHPNANLASRAAESAGNQGKFWELGDVLFTNQSTWSPMAEADFRAWLEEQAVALELNGEQFLSDLDSDAIIQEVTQSYEKAISVGLNSVPSLFVNGMFVGNMDYNALSNLMKVYDHDANTYDECPPFLIDQEKTYTATIETEKGDVVVELFADKAPLAVNSFVFLAQEGYFDNVTFHRVLKDFVAQTGDPTGTGWSDPGYQFRNEIVEGLVFDSAGLLGMANSGVDTNGSQFFITYAATADLTGSYTIFGRVIEGMDVVESLTDRDPSSDPNAPAGDIIINIKINEK